MFDMVVDSNNSVRVPRNFVTKHWYGQYSLGRSFWVQGLEAGFIVSTMSTFIESWPGGAEKFGSDNPMLALTILSAMVGAMIWWWIGTWRAAQYHVRRSGRKFWARTAQGVLVLLMLSWAHNFIISFVGGAHHVTYQHI